jgi:hypothetical protein
VTQPSLDKIIEQLQFCIVDAKALQLKMMERILSIALLEAYEIKEKSSNGRGKRRGLGARQNQLAQKAAKMRFRFDAHSIHLAHTSMNVTTSASAAREVR